MEVVIIKQFAVEQEKMVVKLCKLQKLNGVETNFWKNKIKQQLNAVFCFLQISYNFAKKRFENY